MGMLADSFTALETILLILPGVLLLALLFLGKDSSQAVAGGFIDGMGRDEGKQRKPPPPADGYFAARQATPGNSRDQLRWAAAGPGPQPALPGR